jgi:hypothetical protein
MRSVIISSALLLVLVVSIAANAYYINSISTEMLDLTFALPSDYGYMADLGDSEREEYKTAINKLLAKWEKNAFRISLVSRYSDYERINSSVHSLKEYFFAGQYAEYASERKKLIAALEKQKNNELAKFENIF